MSPLIRQWLLLKTLCSRGVGESIRQLAEQMEVSEKTIRRDISTFLAAGLPIEESIGQNGLKQYRLEPSAARAEMAFTFDEALALYLGRRYLLPFAGTHLWAAAQNAFRKVKACLGEKAIRYVEQFSDIVRDSSFAATDYASQSDVLDQLLIGIEDHKVVFITYRSERATEPVTYDIHPYRFTRHINSLYLQGLKVEDEAIRTWKLDRIEKAEVDVVPFAMPSAVELDRQLSGVLGVFHAGDEAQAATIRFSRKVARYVSETTWHPSQELVGRAGGIEATFTLTDFTDLKSWVLSFGSQAEVLSPPSLREEIASELRAAGKQYVDSTSTDKSEANKNRPR